MTTDSLVDALENLPLGEPWADALAAAESAIARVTVTAREKLFPLEIAPATADALAEYAWRTNRLAAADYGDRLAEIHGRAVVGHPELACLLRSQEALEDIGRAAAQLAAPVDRLETHVAAGARAATKARMRYELAIAQQLAAADDHKLSRAARELLANEDLANRLAVAKARHEDNAQLELARAASERQAAARVVVDRTVERVRDAEARAADARARAEQSALEYRRIRADALIELLRLSGLKELRMQTFGVGERAALYGVEDIINTAHGLSLASIARFEAALAAHGGS